MVKVKGLPRYSTSGHNFSYVLIILHLRRIEKVKMHDFVSFNPVRFDIYIIRCYDIVVEISTKKLIGK